MRYGQTGGWMVREEDRQMVGWTEKIDWDGMGD